MTMWNDRFTANLALTFAMQGLAEVHVKLMTTDDLSELKELMKKVEMNVMFIKSEIERMDNGHE